MRQASLINEKKELERQLTELAGLIDGLGNPTVLATVTKLEACKAEMSGRLSNLSSEIDFVKDEISSISSKILKCSGGATQQILNAISAQRIFSIKNKPKLVFDSHTGCLFPNIGIFPNALKFYTSRKLPATFPAELSEFSIENIEGYLNFALPTDTTIGFYSRSVGAVIGQLVEYSLAADSSCDSDKDIKNYFSGPTRTASFLSGKTAVAFPFSVQLAAADFFPDATNFNKDDHSQKTLSLFIQEGWVPQFDDENMTALYERIYLARPAIIQALNKVMEQLAAMPAPTACFADRIEVKPLIKEYDLAAIRGSQVTYYAETTRWLDNLLANLDAFVREQAGLLAEAQTLAMRLTGAQHDDEYPVLTGRALYLAQHLDFGVEAVRAKLICFKNDAVSGRQRLDSACDFAALCEVEKLERPDFHLIAEHTAEIVRHQLAGVDWFSAHKDLATSLIDLHEAWRDDFHLFEHTTHDHFIQRCRGESIDQERADGWFAEWRKERLLLEEHLLPLMKAGMEKIIPVETVVAGINLLKGAICDQLGRFFFDERIALYQRFAFVPGGEIQERFEKEFELSKINTGFQRALEELIFTVESSEGRLFLVRWAKDWYDSFLGDVLALIEQDPLQQQIARETLDEFRALQRKNLEAFLSDVKSYAEARDQIDKQLNSLVFRMRSDLVKKAKK